MDDEFTTIITLLEEDIDKSATLFVNYEEAKSRRIIDLKIAIVPRKKNKLVKNLKERFGKGGEGEEYDDEDEEEEEWGQAPLALTQGQGEY